MASVDDRIAPPEGSRWHWDDLREETAGASDAPRVVRRRRGRAGGGTDGPAPLGHQPSLDGLRAVAVGAVLVYHARFSWAEGGFLGVSAFFTLSGFLITSLLLREGLGRDQVDLRRFWRRRFRRLLPASWTTLGLVLAMGAIGLWTTDQLRDLRSDVPFSLAEIVNWHFIAADRSYGARFVAPSPVEHFWSLSVEQQFYVVLPLLVIGGLAWGRRRARNGHGPLVPLVVILGGLGVASAVANGILARSSVDRAYFGTDTRMAEMIVGALLACALVHGTSLRSATARTVLRVLAVVALGVTVWLWHVATVDSSWLYPWGLLLTATATATIILGALQGRGLGAALSWRPLVWLGGISYGIYLLHWPIFLWLSPARTGWAPWPLFALRMAVTLVAAVVLYRLVEHPVRSGGVLRPPKGVAVAGVALVALLVADVAVTHDLPGLTSLQRAEAGATAGAAPAAAPVKVLVVGDELAASLQPAPGERVKGLDVQVAAAPGCGIAMGGWVQLPDGRIEREPDRCGQVRDTWVAAATRDRPDVIVVWGALRDVANRRLAVEDPWLASTDPAADDFLRSDVGDLADDLTATGAKVVFLAAPHLRNQTLPSASPPEVMPTDAKRRALQQYRDLLIAEGAPAPTHTENDDARIDHWNELLAGVAGDHGATFVDAGARLRSSQGGELDPALRAAGVGVTAAGRRDLFGWLAPQLRQVVERSSAAAATPQVAAEAPLPPAPPVTPRRKVPASGRSSVLVVGDSVAYGYAFGLQLWGKGRSDIRSFNAAQLGCPVARGGSYRFLRNYNEFEARCDWSSTFPRFVQEQSPDVVVLSSGIWEVVDRRLPGDSRWRHVGQPQVDDYILREFLSAIDTLAAKGATVVLLTYPHFNAGSDQGYSGLPESDPARVDRLNELLRQAVSLRPGEAKLIDFQAWLAQQPGGEIDDAKRQDGLHFKDEYVPTIAAWLGPQLLQIAHGG